MSQPKTLIYAEQLSNIRQISIIATLNTPSDSTTNAKLSANSQQIILHHGGETTTLDLPGQVASSAQLQKPVLGRQELSWRLPTAGQPSRADLESTQSIEAPWSAKSLGEDAEFACKECGNVVVKKGIIKTWKDLPSENWAEMMDFWHCHKPDVEPNGSSDHASEDHVDGDHVHGTSAATRRYGANTKFLATPGVGFVDITTFLLSESDCTGIALTGISAANQTQVLSDKSKDLTTNCGNCGKYIGVFDNQGEGIRLYKWRLQCSTASENSSASAVTISLCLSTQLLSFIQSQIHSRFLITSKPSLLSDSLHVWVFATWLRVSRTKTSTPSSFATVQNGSLHGSNETTDCTLAMKVFWRKVDWRKAGELMEKDGVEELALPAEAILEMEASLRRSSLMLPPSARTFQDWDVGLLERWEE